MSDTVNMIDSQTIQVLSTQSQTYNINDLITQANNITQNITVLQANLNNLNSIIASAQGAGLNIVATNLVDQSQALPVSKSIATLLSTSTGSLGSTTINTGTQTTG